MTQTIPEGLERSSAMRYIISKGWSFNPPSGGQIAVEKCPFCSDDRSKFYMAVSDPEQDSRDGLFFCHKCQTTGNLRRLQEHCGDRIVGIESKKEWAGKEGTSDDLPDVNLCHSTLLGDAEAMDYLLNVRGFSKEIIEKQKLGLKEKVYFRKSGETRALVIPYLSIEGNTTFAKFRTIPPAEKDFTCPRGWEAGLYNSSILTEECKELIMVEGECDALSLMSHGINNVVGVPGANVHKTTWIDALDKLNPKIYILYDSDKAGTKGAQELASKIGLDKCLKITLPRGVKDINEFFIMGGTVEAFENLKKNATLFDVTGVTSAGDALSEIEEELNGKEELAPSRVTQWEDFNKLVGFDDGDVIDIVAGAKVGKLQPLDSKVLTPKGWVLNRDLKIGDEIASIDGLPNFVTGIFPQGNVEILKVTFSDGRSTEVGREHLWKVADIGLSSPEWHVYTTDAIRNEYKKNTTGNNQKPGNLRQQLQIPLISGDFGTTTALPIDPWLLGVLIGDGSFVSGSPDICNADDELIDRVKSVVETLGLKLKEGGKIRSRNSNGHIKEPKYTRIDFSISSGKEKNNYITNQLRTLKLWGHRAEEKFIPPQYLNSSKEQRWELLRGLMDTDGTAGNKHGVLSYCTVSQRLANDVIYLVRSLGGIAKLPPVKKTTFRYKGEFKKGQPAYIIVIRLPEREKAFFLKRKLERVKPRERQPLLKFSHITSVGFKEAQCISVSHPSKLYITDDFIVTHNTTLGLNIMDHMVSTYGEDGLIVCLEMTQKKMAKKWVSLVTSFEDNIVPPGSPEAKSKLEEFKIAVAKAKDIQKMRTADLYFAYPQMVKEAEDVFKLIRDSIRRYGVKWVMVDNLQLLCDTILGSRQGQRTVVLSQISKALARIAKDYGIKMIRIVQPKQLEKGAVIESRDVDGSSQIEKDCDCQILLWRRILGGAKTQSQYAKEEEEAVDTSEVFDPQMKMTVALSRYSSGGSCWVIYDGARSQVTSKPKRTTFIPQQNFNGILTQEIVVPTVLPQEKIQV